MALPRIQDLALSCGDGVALEALNFYTKKTQKPSRVDRLTRPGIVKILARWSHDEALQSIHNELLTYIKAHRPRIIYVVGHYDCAGNPVTDKQHALDLADAAFHLKQHWGKELAKLGVEQILGVYGQPERLDKIFEPWHGYEAKKIKLGMEAEAAAAD